MGQAFAPALRLAFYSMPNDDQREYLEDEQRHTSLDLARFASSAGFGEPRQIVRYEANAARHEIMKAAEEEKADLVVLSTHGRTGAAKLLIGSVTEHVLKNAAVDVLALPAVHDL
ncbi:universal stress protein [Citreimonas salinaria]|uniref:Universal stress protein family protein n=1 Tax=Citreimonas salinaria TaxID=321339 RepID=A0A1H3M4B9_9RHOB|nr:universal stress protein [Citreimonas salinaria]SDY70865.1 Universal stress protein family protein [Citreimonas salinaria]